MIGASVDLYQLNEKKKDGKAYILFILCKCFYSSL